MTLSSETMLVPPSSTAPRRFSVSSAFFEAVMTGQSRPVLIMAKRSTR